MRVAAAIVVLALFGVVHADEDDEMGRRVQALLRAHQADVFSCVLTREAGEALVHVVVGENHQPLKVEVLKADAAVQKAASCVADRARQWDLASLQAATGDQVVFPLAFRPDANDGSVSARLSLRTTPGLYSSTRTGQVALAFFVVSGKPTWMGTQHLSAGDVVYMPDGRYELNADRSTKLVEIDAATQAGGAPVVRHLADTTRLSLPGGSADVRLYLDGVAAPFAVDKLCAKKGARIPLHTHDSDELLYILSGQGTTMLDKETLATKAGDFITIPRHTPHALTVDADLCAVQVYAPAGPEQRFKVQPRSP